MYSIWRAKTLTSFSTSPSIYIAFNTLSAHDLCSIVGNVGVYDTKAFNPDGRLTRKYESSLFTFELIRIRDLNLAMVGLCR